MYVYMCSLILARDNQSINDNIQLLNDINDPFNFLKIVITDNFKLTSGVDYELAKLGDEFELAKIALIILQNGVAWNINQFIETSDRLDKNMFQIGNILTKIFGISTFRNATRVELRASETFFLIIFFILIFYLIKI